MISKEAAIFLISVVIPAHNRAELLFRAVKSVLNQSFRDLECLVIDDCSTDNTLELLSSLSDRRLRVFSLQDLFQGLPGEKATGMLSPRWGSYGVSLARNTGVGFSQGDFIAFLDSDDYWLPEKLELQLDFMRGSGFDITQTEEIWYRGGVRVNQKNVHLQPDGEAFSRSLELCCISPSSVLLKREVFRRCGPFDESLPACEDYDLWLRVAATYPVGLLKKKLIVKEGGRPDQLSRKIVGLDLFRIRSIIKLLESADLTIEQREEAIKVLAAKRDVYVRGCLMHYKPEEALRVKELCRPWINTISNLETREDIF